MWPISTRKSLIIIREIQIKITKRCHLTLYRMVITKKITSIFVKDVENLETLCTIDMQNDEKQYGVSSKNAKLIYY